MVKQTKLQQKLGLNEIRTISELTDSSAASVDKNPDTVASNMTLNLLNLEANDFPDVCIMCESCMH